MRSGNALNASRKARGEYEQETLCAKGISGEGGAGIGSPD